MVFSNCGESWGDFLFRLSFVLSAYQEGGTREAHVGYRARRGISKASAPAFSAKNARLK